MQPQHTLLSTMTMITTVKTTTATTYLRDRKGFERRRGNQKTCQYAMRGPCQLGIDDIILFAVGLR